MVASHLDEMLKGDANIMVAAFLIMKGTHPSVCHSRFLDEGEARTEVNRLETSRLLRNTNIQEHPATGQGSCFLNILDNEPWTYQYHEFPQ